MTHRRNVTIEKNFRYLMSHQYLEPPIIRIIQGQSNLNENEIRALVINQEKQAHVPRLTFKGNSLLERRSINFSRLKGPSNRIV